MTGLKMNRIGALIVCSILIMAASVRIVTAQPYQNKPREGKLNFQTMQREFLEWSKDKDLGNTKGWKYYKRWEYDMQMRTPLSGSISNQKELFNAAREVAYQKQTQKALNKSAQGPEWSPIGPMGAAPGNGVGRINCIEFHPTDTNTFWVGVAQGGVWKTTDHGASWTPLTDDLPIIRVSDITVDVNDPDIMYLSMGDYAYIGAGLDLDDRKRNTHYGIGVYKSTDGGTTWNATGLFYDQTGYDNTLMRRVILDPTDVNNLVAAGIDGIYRSTDAGDNWSKMDSNVIWDIEQDPQNPEVIYASRGQVYNLGIGNGQSGILKSTDFGLTWNLLTTGIPTDGSIERIELALTAEDSNYVYAIAASTGEEFAGLYRSIDGGANWTEQSSGSNTSNIFSWSSSGSGGQATYDMAFLVHPKNKEQIYMGGINIWGSNDGGATWQGASHWTENYGPSIHADQHQLKYNPLDDKIYICNDGGLARTDSIETVPSWGSVNWPTVWEKLNANRMSSSFYKLGVSQASDSNIIAGAQDNSTFYKNGSSWSNIIGGDGMDCLMHPTDPLTLYGSWQFGNLCRSYDGGLSIDYAIDNVSDAGEWVTPYMLDPNAPDVVYSAKGNLWRSIDKGDNWSQISGFPVISGYGYPSPASAMDVSPANSDYIYVAKRVFHGYNEAGGMWVTKNGGSDWTDITAGLPDSLYFTDVEVSNTDENVAWVTCGAFIDGVKVFKTTDAGTTWTNISSNLPNVPINNIEHEDSSVKNTVYLATDVGVYYQTDLSTDWILFSDGLPNVIVSDIEMHYPTNSMYVATFGRGIWKVDFAEINVPIGGVKGSTGYYPIDVAPNPNDGSFRLELQLDKKQLSQLASENARIDILNGMGQVVYSEQLGLSKLSNGITFSNLKLSAGFYYVKIPIRGKTSVKKFVVK